MKICGKSDKVVVMAHQVPGWPMFLVGTLLLRWYVFVFLAVFLVLAGRDLGWRRAFVWMGWARIA